MTLPPGLERYRAVDEKVVEAITGRAVGSLRNDRSAGVGIPFFRIGRSCRYRLSDVLQYVEQRRACLREGA